MCFLRPEVSRCKTSLAFLRCRWYDSAHKVRENFWLPSLQSFKTRFPAELTFKYLTFAGPEGRDIEFFTSGHKIFSVQNVSVWEKSEESAKALGLKFGPELRIKLGEAFTLSSAGKEEGFFPYSVINLDFTSGFFNLRKNRISPYNFELIQNLVRNQQRHACSFVLLLAFNVAPDVDGVQGQAFVHKMAFDIATRFGSTKALFNLTRDAKRNYDDVLSDLVPTAIIRLGGEHAFDTTCVGKAVYRPYGIRKSTMLCLSFEFWYDNPPLSQSTHLVAQRMEEIITKRQQESLAIELIDINKLRSPTGRGVSKSARARHRKLFASEKQRS